MKTKKINKAIYYISEESLGGTPFNSGSLTIITPSRAVLWMKWGHNAGIKSKRKAIRECRFIVNAFNSLKQK